MDLDDLEELDWLEEVTSTSVTNDDVDKLYRIYINEVCATKFNEKRIVINSNRSAHPICRGKHQTFEHIITWKSNDGRRYFDKQRACRIHWIKPIVENMDNPRIKYFQKYHSNGQLQHYFWYDLGSYVVIIREISPNGNMLITAFEVEQIKKNNFKKDYEKFKQNKTPLRE